mmetsp:Transcript_14242/g.40020  ORF Transcript_14242/g.40020 Transcript_14242/m.40020 type:complete len:104 (-) Transcript_14242:33-344(-)
MYLPAMVVLFVVGRVRSGPCKLLPAAARQRHKPATIIAHNIPPNRITNCHFIHHLLTNLGARNDFQLFGAFLRSPAPCPSTPLTTRKVHMRIKARALHEAIFT